MKKVAILQSNYIPWKGYFDIIRQVDLFIFLDDVQYTRNDWRQRNRIKTPLGSSWITIPCGSSRTRMINQVRVDQADWQVKHFQLLKQNYNASPYWKDFAPFLSSVYLDRKWQYLSELNQYLVRCITNEFLGCKTSFDNSENYALNSTKETRILELLEKVGATHYLSGPAAKSYLREESFLSRGITLDYIDYSAYPTYPQCFGPFEHAVTILDLLLNTGPRATEFLLPVR